MNSEKFIIHNHVWAEDLPAEPEQIRDVLQLINHDYDIMHSLRDDADYYIVEHTYE